MALGQDTLPALREHLGDCRRCALAQTRTTLVFGAGEAGARVMLVGEAPGRNEDLTGQPFVGSAGRLLDGLLATAGLARTDVYIANVLKCRPPGNRDPRPEEIECCTPFLARQIAIVSPEIVVTLGNFATRFMLGTAEGITTLRGTLVEVDAPGGGPVRVFPVFHPAATIYDRTKRELLEADFASLAGLLGIEPLRRPPGAGPGGPAGGPVTQPLFDPEEAS